MGARGLPSPEVARFLKPLNLALTWAAFGPPFFFVQTYCRAYTVQASENWYQLVPSGTKMAKRETLVGRWKLPKSLAEELQDFSEAHRGSPEQRIIADALRAFIDDRLDAEPELKKRFDAAREARLGQKDKVVKLVENKE